MNKKIVLLFLALTMQLLTFAQRGLLLLEIDGEETQLYKESYALVIGVSDYTYWPDLPGVKKDVAKVKTALEKHGFTVTSVDNPTLLELKNAFDTFIEKYGNADKKETRLLIYFAGHGHTIITNYGDTLGYIVPKDAPNPNNNEAKFQSAVMLMKQIDNYALTIQAKHSIFLFDACFSGSLFSTQRAIPQEINDKTKLDVRQFITSGSIDETVPDESIFCEQLIEALTTDYADNNKDGYLTGTELGKYLQTNVINYSKDTQHPQYGKIKHPKLDKGDFVFKLESGPPPTTGALQITSKNVTGKLYIDNIYRETITEGAVKTYSDLTTGVHAVRIASTPTEWTEKIMIIAGQTTYITAEIEKPITTGTLIINSTNITAKLYINDIYYLTLIIGKNTINNLEKGTYTLKADTWTETVTITANKTTTVTATKIEEEPKVINLPEMVKITGRAFTMGASDLSYTEHSVTLSDYYMGKYEVTNIQFAEFLNDYGQITTKSSSDYPSQTMINLSGSYSSATYGEEKCRISQSGTKFTVASGYNDYAIIYVTWYGAYEYCKWLSEKTGEKYSLPSEAQWEYAAGGGSTHQKWSGTTSESELYKYANYWQSPSTDGYKNVAPVGKFKANTLGLYDMSGNVWEWCMDWYDSGYYSKSAKKDPVNTTDGSGRVVRGGSWSGYAAYARVAYRDYYTPTFSGFNLGFRVHKTL